MAGELLDELTDYARSRESRRAQGVWLMGGFTVLLVVSAILHGGGLWLTVFLFALGFACAILVITMIVPVHPDHLVSLREKPVGSWPASMRARSFQEVLDLHPNIADGTLTGSISFEDQDVIVWRAARQYWRGYGQLERRWVLPYDLKARRLKGMGHQVHVAIRTGPDPEQDVDDMWLRRAQDFPI